MAILDHNLLLHGASGSIDNYYTRQHRGKTQLCRKPRSKDGWKAKGGQIENREKFKAANAYAKRVLNDPELLAVYEGLLKKYEEVQNIAVRDAFRPPEILDLDVDFNPATEKLCISIIAVDDTKVVSVEVTLMDCIEQVLLQGQALRHPYNHNKWIFEADNVTALPESGTIEAIAYDIPGNRATATLLTGN
ncbi:hypothetical protein [Flavihumibacter petaseus]|uniref:Uncharacterized protein n=1 Tax=Flavihumibacter petaseus NBRC 106054 TaxID=1220578 RepID=A0A0E9N3W2_9BACT|nr:hypothetical protein [Flavihumibacter petaseus]GAO44672.1 hypothetical protein FPE01S_03_07110 [Flavihumibacter petaseus NBRC 106054]